MKRLWAEKGNHSKMQLEIGKQYSPDDEFRAKARLHQSVYRRDKLRVDCDIYGNMLNEQDGKDLLNYFPNLGVRETLRQRYPRYSKMRDANLLRSEHIPFNMFAPLISNPAIAIATLNNAFDGDIKSITQIKIEYAPEPKAEFLNDGTSFDVFVEYLDSKEAKCGYGIEVKYTEHEYAIGQREKEAIENNESKYWAVTKRSGIFNPATINQLATDKMRQIWRNHLLGLAMTQIAKLDEFRTVTIFPEGNKHFQSVLPQYQNLLKDPNERHSIGCTFEKYINSISGPSEIQEWKIYLIDRYLVNFG